MGSKVAFQVDLKFKLRPENGNGSVSQANEAVREEYSRRREEHMQRPRGRRRNMTHCGKCKQSYYARAQNWEWEWG